MEALSQMTGTQSLVGPTAMPSAGPGPLWQHAGAASAELAGQATPPVFADSLRQAMQTGSPLSPQLQGKSAGQATARPSGGPSSPSNASSPTSGGGTPGHSTTAPVTNRANSPEAPAGNDGVPTGKPTLGQTGQRASGPVPVDAGGPSGQADNGLPSTAPLLPSSGQAAGDALSTAAKKTSNAAGREKKGPADGPTSRPRATQADAAATAPGTIVANAPPSAALVVPITAPTGSIHGDSAKGNGAGEQSQPEGLAIGAVGDGIFPGPAGGTQGASVGRDTSSAFGAAITVNGMGKTADNAGTVAFNGAAIGASNGTDKAAMGQSAPGDPAAAVHASAVSAQKTLSPLQIAAKPATPAPVQGHATFNTTNAVAGPESGGTGSVPQSNEGDTAGSASPAAQGATLDKTSAALQTSGGDAVKASGPAGNAVDGNGNAGRVGAAAGTGDAMATQPGGGMAVIGNSSGPAGGHSAAGGENAASAGTALHGDVSLSSAGAGQVGSHLWGTPGPAGWAASGASGRNATGVNLTAESAFASLDRASAAEQGHVLRLSPNQFVVGVTDPQLGWLEVGAERAAGHLTVQVGASSVAGQEALAASLPAMAGHLYKQGTGVERLTITQSFHPDAGPGGQAGHGQGGNNQNATGDGQAPRAGTGAQTYVAGPSSVAAYTAAGDVSWTSITATDARVDEGGSGIESAGPRHRVSVLV